MEANERWTRKNIWIGLLFLAFGIMIVVYSLMAMSNDFPIYYWGLGWILGSLMIFIGGNGVIRSLCSSKVEEDGAPRRR